MSFLSIAGFSFIALFSFACIRRHLRVRRKISIAHIQCPPSNSFLLGNFLEYFQAGVGEYEFQWQEKFGAVYRFKGLFGEDRLLVADPKALQYIYSTAGVTFLKPTIRKEFGRLFLGRGIAYVEKDDHKRHRKIMTPAFRNIDSRQMIPIFHQTANKLCHHWKVIIGGSSDGRTACIDIAGWLTRSTMDAIGEVAFNYQFNSLDSQDNKLAEGYISLLVNAFGLPTRAKIFMQQVLVYMPMSLFRILERIPSRSLQGLRNVAIEGNRVAKMLVDQKVEALRNGSEEIGKDVLSLLVKANASEDPKNRLSEEELMAQVRTVIAAGLETTGATIAFLLYEVAQRPIVQEKIRSEVFATLQSVRLRGDTEFTAADLEAMKYTTAVMKEVLRLHPVVYGPFLLAAGNDVIPLSKPILTLDGKMISQLSVGAGQYIHISISGYNRLKDVWGENAHDFSPERWLGLDAQAVSSPFGIYSNLGNFVSGAQSCLGWRFAIIEIQIFLIEIVRQFQLSYPEDAPKVIRATSGVMAPVLEGEVEKGKQLPLNISILQ